MEHLKIGLYNLEPKIVNTAMMQVSQYHKKQGDTVETYYPLYHNSYDKVYAFSLCIFMLSISLYTVLSDFSKSRDMFTDLEPSALLKVYRKARLLLHCVCASHIGF